jgi:class 3 adenylate cyclase
MLQWLAPSVADDERFKRWFRTYARLSASPGAARDLSRMNMEIDVRQVLPAIRVPTLVLNRAEDQADQGRYLAAQIPGARYVELPGRDHAPWVGDADALVEAVREFVTSVWEERAWEEAEPDRVLATVLFTDIVGSSEKAASLGDRAWRELLERHHAEVRRQLVRFRGTEVDTAGDGFFASFDGPARAIRCATAIVESMPELGLEVRAGLHTGECELVDDKVAGIAVHTGARVASQARPGEVLVSSTVKDLVAGSGLAFADRGAHELKGIPGEWRLYAVEC